MPIKITLLNKEGKTTGSRIKEEILKILNDNPTLSYSTMDFTSITKHSYSQLSVAIRDLKRRNILDWKWVVIDHKRELYYYLNKEGKEDE